MASAMRGLIEAGMPLVHGELAGDERGAFVEARAADLQEIGYCGPAARANSADLRHPELPLSQSWSIK